MFLTKDPELNDTTDYDIVLFKYNTNEGKENYLIGKNII